MKLYSFSKGAWHVRFFKWLFNEDPTRRYKTMCPYFWTYVLILLFLPIILFIKLFGKFGTQFLKWSKDYKYNREKIASDALIFRCSREDLTPEEGYNIYRSKCYKTYWYDLDYDSRCRIEELFYEHRNHINYLKRVARDKKEVRNDRLNKKIVTFKEYKSYTYISYLIVGLLGLILLYSFYYMGSMFINSINWTSVWVWFTDVGLPSLLILFIVIAGVYSIYILVKYVLKPFFLWLSCRKLPTCKLCNGLSRVGKFLLYLVYPLWWVILGIGKFFVIIGHMIYSTYKKSCPIITWEDDE